MIINKTNFGIVDLSSTVGPQSGKPKLHITSKCVSFNAVFCKQLNYPKYVDMYINTEKRLVAFKGLDKKTPTCRNFYQPRKKEAAGHSVNWSGKKIVEAMNKIFKPKNEPLNLIGEATDGVIVFDIGVGGVGHD